MSEPNRQNHEADADGIDVFGLVRAHGRAALTAAVASALLVAALGGIFVMWLQPAKQISSLEFRLTFSGAGQMQYPNGLPFSVSDIIAGPIVNRVYDQSEVEPFCERDSFQGGFYVEQYSDQSLLLDLEYQSRLSDPSLELADRRVMEEEYAARRAALPVQYRLMFITPAACMNLPAAVIVKSLTSVLATWAEESETRRGVLNHQVEVLSPSTLSVVPEGPGGWVLRADLLRTALERMISNVSEVAAIPGAGLVRVGKERLTFLEVRGRLEDLLSARLEPLVMTSGRSPVQESSVWVNETVASAERDQRLAESRAAVYREALREFSRATLDADAPRGAGAQGSGPIGNQAMAPQVDRSFVDRIVEMSLATDPYRRELTDRMVEASLEAVSAQNRATYYRRLLQSLREPGGAQLSSQELDARLAEIVEDGKALSAQFIALYEELNRVSLRPAGAMYQTPKPVKSVTARAFGRRDLANAVMGVFLAILLLSFGGRVLRERLTSARA